MIRIYELIATGLGLGFVPVAPGTAGAIGALFIWMLISYFFVHVAVFIIVLILFSLVLGVISARKIEAILGTDDKKIVIDEMSGMWVSVMFIPFSWGNDIAAFLLFRFFDIVKPLFIRRVEKLENGFGVMLDDVVAGLNANVVLQVALIIKSRWTSVR